MRNVISIREGDNFGTAGDDFFEVNEKISSFELEAGAGYDILRANVGYLNRWGIDDLERYEFYGSRQEPITMHFGRLNQSVDASFSEADMYGTVLVHSSDCNFIGNGKISVTVTHKRANVNFDMISGSYSETSEYKSISNIFKEFNHIKCGNGNNNILGSMRDDIVEFSVGNSLFDGRDGLDTVRIDRPNYEFTVKKTSGGYVVEAPIAYASGKFDLVNVERVEFAPKFSSPAGNILAFDLEGAAGQTYRLYQAAFARTPDTDGLRHNVKLVDAGMTQHQMSSAFLGSAEFIQRYGSNTSDSAYINALYNNVLGRDAETAGLAGWIERLSSGAWDRAGVLIGFSESAENKALVAPAIENGIWLL